jgi:hypothetical protein
MQTKFSSALSSRVNNDNQVPTSCQAIRATLSAGPSKTETKARAARSRSYLPCSLSAFCPFSWICCNNGAISWLDILVEWIVQLKLIERQSLMDT